MQRAVAVTVGIVLAAVAIGVGYGGYVLAFAPNASPVVAIFGCFLMTTCFGYLIVRAFFTIANSGSQRWNGEASNATGFFFTQFFDGCGGIVSILLGAFIVFFIGGVVFGGVQSLWGWLTTTFTIGGAAIFLLGAFIALVLLGIYVRLGRIARSLAERAIVE